MTTLSDEQIADMREDATHGHWDDLSALLTLCDEVIRLRAERASMKAWQTDVEEREAAVCPEDVKFDEWIRVLTAERDKLATGLQRAKELRDGWNTEWQRLVALGAQDEASEGYYLDAADEILKGFE